MNIAVKTSTDRATLARKKGLFRMRACAAMPPLGALRTRGTTAAISTATSSDSSASRPKAARQPTASDTSVPNGMPNSMAAEMPR